MATLLILYNRPEDPAAFERYYAERHLPWASETMPGVIGAELRRIERTPDGRPPPYYRSAEMTWPDRASLDAALASTAGQTVLADTENFATGGAVMLITEDGTPATPVKAPADRGAPA